MKVLIIADRPNWAFDSQAKGLISNSKYPYIEYDLKYMINWQKFNDIDFTKYDIIFPMGLLGCVNHYKFIKNCDYVTLSHHHPWNSGAPRNIDQTYIDNELEVINNSLRHASISLDIKNKWKQTYNMNSYYLPSGIDTKNFKPNDKNRNKLVFGWVGNTNKKVKNFKWIKRVMNIITEKYSNVEFKYRDFSNLVPHHQMVDFYNSIDVYLCASSHEGLPTPLVEASACGKPFVSTNVGVVPEINRHGHNFIVEHNYESLKKGILKAIHNNIEREIAGRLNREIILQGWSWDIVAYLWENFIMGNMGKFKEYRNMRRRNLYI